MSIYYVPVSLNAEDKEVRKTEKQFFLSWSTHSWVKGKVEHTNGKVIHNLSHI